MNITKIDLINILQIKNINCIVYELGRGVLLLRSNSSYTSIIKSLEYEYPVPLGIKLIYDCSFKYNILGVAVIGDSIWYKFLYKIKFLNIMLMLRR
jgi:hypothetical protein